MVTGPGSAGGGREFPWWFVAILGLGIAGAAAIIGDELHARIFAAVWQGVTTTIFVAVTAFALASALGLGIAMMALSRWTVLRQTARFYVEILRGIPALVLLLYVAFVGAPAIVDAVNWLSTPLRAAGIVDAMTIRDFPLVWRAIVALALAYSAFVSEIFRAGIQSVEAGQVEAAKALGLNGRQRFRLVVMPQAIRIILPPLGNDFVAMVKDSSLASVLGVADVTQLGKVYASGSFRFFETYNIVAYVYLVLTISLSIMLRRIENRLRRTDAMRGSRR